MHPAVTLKAMTKQLPLEDFPFRVSEPLRYNDTDRQGHVNNAVYLTFLEAGRSAFMNDPRIRLFEPGTSFVLARVSLNYLSEILWPGEVEIGTRVLTAAGSSIRMQQGIFVGDELKASAETLMVLVNNETRRPQRLSAESRTRLEPFITPKE